MFKDKGKWRATQPTHLIGWTIIMVTDDVPDENGEIELEVEQNASKDKRRVRANSNAIPVAVVSRRWNSLG